MGESSRRPPSLLRRALVALALLFGFYAVTSAVALVLFIAPFLPGLAAHHSSIADALSHPNGLMIPLAWIPAVGLLWGLVSARPPKYEPPGHRLEPSQAPALFDLLEELARAAGTAAPREVYLTATADLAVTQTGGFFGMGATRILILGLPLAEELTVAELRSGLAHEIGHFLGGDTRLAGVTAYTRRLIASVHQRMQQVRFGHRAAAQFASAIGKLLVDGYASLYLHLTKPTDRRLELAADALSVRLVGRATARRALETISYVAPMHEIYLQIDVQRAMAIGALPTDLVDGFRSFRKRFAELPIHEELEKEVRDRETALFDSHPSLRERLAAIELVPEGDSFVDDRPASTLFAIDSAERATWLVAMTRPLLGLALAKPLAERPWAELTDAVFVPELAQRSSKIAQQLWPFFPGVTTKRGLLREVVARLAVEGPVPLVIALEPNFRQLRPDLQTHVGMLEGGRVVGRLLVGALLEVGAAIEPSLGEPCLVYRWNEERVLASKLANDAMKQNDARDFLLALVERIAAV